MLSSMRPSVRSGSLRMIILVCVCTASCCTPPPPVFEPTAYAIVYGRAEAAFFAHFDPGLHEVPLRAFLADSRADTDRQALIETWQANPDLDPPDFLQRKIFGPAEADGGWPGSVEDERGTFVQGTRRSLADFLDETDARGGRDEP